MPNWAWNRDNYLENKLQKIFLQRKWFDAPKEINMQNFEIYDLDIPEISSTLARTRIKTNCKVSFYFL